MLNELQEQTNTNGKIVYRNGQMPDADYTRYEYSQSKFNSRLKRERDDC